MAPEIQLFKGILKGKNEFGDTILIVKIHKDGLVLESRIENAIPKLQSSGPIISKSPLQSINILEVNDCREEIDITEEIEMDPSDSFN